jgi:hypothetical protein
MSHNGKHDLDKMYQELDSAKQLVWQRAKACGGGACVEVAKTKNGNVALRDSKNPQAGTLLYTPAEWDAFTQAVKKGEFDA